MKADQLPNTTMRVSTSLTGVAGARADESTDLRAATPFFEVCPVRLNDTWLEFKALFPDAAIHYAMKANSTAGILKTLADAGANFEVASPGELQLLEQACGHLAPDRLIFGTAVKSRGAIAHFKERGIDRITADSAVELSKIAQVAPGARVHLRVKTDVVDSTFNMSDKFGAPVADAAELLLLARRLGLIPSGLSFNVGSQARDVRAWAKAIDALKPAMEQLLGEGIRPESLNIGGGYPIEYPHQVVPPLSAVAEHIHAALSTLPYQPQLILEPGRALVANAVQLTTTVIARVTRDKHEWLFLDAGVYNALFEALACQGLTRYEVERLHDAPRGDGATTTFVLAGPTGDGLDVIDRAVVLPADVSEGDRLCFRGVGAYGSALANSFNGFQPAPTLLHGQGTTCGLCPVSEEIEEEEAAS